MIVGLLAGMLAVLALFYAYVKHTTAKLQADLDAAMKDLAQEAVKKAQSEGVTLDFSPGSVEQVEAILGQLHESHAAGNIDVEITNQAAMVWGAYVGEVIRRREGGAWNCYIDSAGGNAYPLAHGDKNDFPVMWCGQRIVNGPSENVWEKFKGLVLQPGAE